jgi:GntR family transcriptional regulator
VRIPIRVSLDHPEPLYHQIKTQLRALIMSGQLEQGMLLPSIRELANDLSCSVITIRRVYQDLENEGLLKTRQGTGTFVAHIEQDEKEKHKLEAVIRAMEEAIKIARQHQYDDEEIQKLFIQCLSKRERED